MLRELGVLPGTAMVIRGDVLLLDTEMVEDEAKTGRACVSPMVTWGTRSIGKPDPWMVTRPPSTAQ